MKPKAMSDLHALVLKHGTAWSEDAFLRAVNDPATLAVTSEAGFALGRQIGSEMELLTVAVLPDQQGQGEGERLLRELEGAATAAGVQKVFLEVASRNAVARSLYEKLAYIVVGRRPRYYSNSSGGSDDAVVMRKTLS